MKQITNIDKNIFYYLLNELKRKGFDSDRRNFDEIKYILDNNIKFNQEEFAYECFYVVCVAGFKQDYAKIICDKITELTTIKPTFNLDDLYKIYKHQNKIKAIKDIWDNRKILCDKFYSCNTIEEKINFLGALAHIGDITKYHLARNLGLNFVKYDIWIQRLVVALYGNQNLLSKINNKKLNLEVKNCCDLMFDNLQKETGEKIGFIDVVLWRSCQKGLIKIEELKVFI